MYLINTSSSNKIKHIVFEGSEKLNFNSWSRPIIMSIDSEKKIYWQHYNLLRSRNI